MGYSYLLFLELFVQFNYYLFIGIFGVWYCFFFFSSLCIIHINSLSEYLAKIFSHFLGHLFMLFLSLLCRRFLFEVVTHSHVDFYIFSCVSRLFRKCLPVPETFLLCFLPAVVFLLVLHWSLWSMSTDMWPGGAVKIQFQSSACRYLGWRD